MAARAAMVVATAAAVLLLAGGASAQSPSSQCTSVLVSLSPCLNYISGNESTAPASCCTQLAKVVDANPQCLCVALNADPASLGLSVNRTRALGLPAACKVTTPDVSNCKGGAAAGGPTTAPGTTTPAGTAPATGSKTTPTTASVPGAAAPRGSVGLAAGFAVAAAALAVVAL